ncbi:hypothetical protein EVC45_31205 [Paraburkholderia sp. UYCP14C]|nr:hypothetical protein EVC45_31205 [Paraburkholderia sp. UYCP14C]
MTTIGVHCSVCARNDRYIVTLKDARHAGSRDVGLTAVWHPANLRLLDDQALAHMERTVHDLAARRGLPEMMTFGGSAYGFRYAEKGAPQAIVQKMADGQRASAEPRNPCFFRVPRGHSRFANGNGCSGSHRSRLAVSETCE